MLFQILPASLCPSSQSVWESRVAWLHLLFCGHVAEMELGWMTWVCCTSFLLLLWRLFSGRMPQIGKAGCKLSSSNPAVLYGIEAFFREDKSVALIFAGMCCTGVVWNVVSNCLSTGNKARLVAPLVVDAVIATALLVGIFHWKMSGVIVASRHAMFVSSFGRLFLRAFLLYVDCNLVSRKLCYQENAFGKVSFTMVLLPTRAYVGTGNPPIGGYMKFLIVSVLLGSMESNVLKMNITLVWLETPNSHHQSLYTAILIYHQPYF